MATNNTSKTDNVDVTAVTQSPEHKGSINGHQSRKIVIDDVEYNGENLSDAAKGALASLQFVEAKLMTLQNELAVHRTARFAYVKALKGELDGKSAA